MDIIIIPEGAENTLEHLVTTEFTAKHIGSGDVAVLSTPAMILFMEQAASRLAQRYLDAPLSTVGIVVNIKHLKAVKVGETVKTTATLKKQDNRKLEFQVQTTHKDEIIGEGQHDRFIIDQNKFFAKLQN